MVLLGGRGRRAAYSLIQGCPFHHAVRCRWDHLGMACPLNFIQNREGACRGSATSFFDWRLPFLPDALLLPPASPQCTSDSFTVHSPVHTSSLGSCRFLKLPANRGSEFLLTKCLLSIQVSFALAVLLKVSPFDIRLIDLCRHQVVT